MLKIGPEGWFLRVWVFKMTSYSKDIIEIGKNLFELLQEFNWSIHSGTFWKNMQ